MKNIAIFASGSGSNAENIANYLRGNNSNINISLILTNNPKAFVLERAEKLGIPSMTFSRTDFYETNKVIEALQSVDLIVLAGFLWLVPVDMVRAFPNKIVNIHPALLPNYGGKGMYGMRVHEAIVANKETETGITIHYVNEAYDEGQIIAQKKCRVELSDTSETVAQKVHKLEYEHFPKTIAQILS